MNWTPAKIATLEAMWKAGCSSGVIGREIGATRNAVLGKARRIGLSRAGGVLSQFLSTHPNSVPRPPRETLPVPVESRVWSLEDAKRRQAFARRASMGARKALEAAGL